VEADARPNRERVFRRRSEPSAVLRGGEDGTPAARDPEYALLIQSGVGRDRVGSAYSSGGTPKLTMPSRADEEVNPPDNPLAVVQRCRDGTFSADLAAGPRRGDPCKESLEGGTKRLRIEGEGRSLSG